MIRQSIITLILLASGLVSHVGHATDRAGAEERQAAETAEQESGQQDERQESQQDANRTAERDQPPSDAETDEEVAEPALTETTEEIIVTGSRIRRDAFTSALPVTVITSESAALAGMANTSEILQTSALASGTQIDNSFGGFVVSGGPGVNTFGLRSLDPGRTLILVNGRRFTPAGTRGQVNSVDLNSIPDVAIDRIEILKDGASSIYGADAIAGVVNIITRKRFDDVILEGYYQDELDYGSVSGLFGKTWDRGYIDAAVEFSSLGPVGRDEQDYSFCDERPLTDGGIHPSIFAPTRGRCFGGVFGFVDVYGLGPATSLVRDPGADFAGTGLPWRELGDRNGERVPEEGYRDDRNWGEEDLIPERRRIQAYSDGLLDFDLGGLLGTVSASYEFYFTHRDESYNNGYRQLFPYVHPANPTNPFGSIGGIAQPVVMSYNLLDPVTEVQNDVGALRLGLEGDLGEFTWKADGGYSWSRGEWTYDVWLKDKVARAMSSAIGPDGNLHCVLDPGQLLYGANFEGATVSRILAAGPDPGCVPLDLFDEATLRRGEIPPEAADYIRDRQKIKTAYDLWTAAFSMEGRLFDAPAGEARGVVGMDWRSRSINDRPPPAAVEDNQWGFTSSGITTGDDRVLEGYTEVEVPLLSGVKLGDVSVAEELTVNGSFRYTHYSSYGSDTTWRLLFNYAVNPVLRMRSSVGTSFRAPALFHLNLAPVTGFVASRADPCDRFRDPSQDLDPTSNQYRNCEALENQGIIPPDYAPSSSIRVASGGNPDLEAETSDSWTLGFILTPDLAGRFPALGLNLSLAFDYYDIDLKNSISRLGASEILSRCYNSLNFSAEECDLVGARNQNGDLAGVNSSYINVAIERSLGYDITVRADREFSFGDLSVDILATRLLAYQYGLGDEKPTNYAGRHSYPNWRGEADVRFQWRDFTFIWTTDYIGSTDEEPVYALPGDESVTNVAEADDKFFHNLSIRYRDPNRRFQVIVGVRNVFDVSPPVVGWSGFSPSIGTAVGYNIPLGAGYSLFDRRIFASFSYDLSSLF
ncbi:MAG: TonB-dependent receptor [Gammaproteobacteria bacterium]|nr:TonB-dependent receptor [Gammaproteobacteria bacterium]MDE0513451.1 TonB-dependent receptor [Gammaproteobacteria bacterium]